MKMDSRRARRLFVEEREKPQSSTVKTIKQGNHRTGLHQTDATQSWRVWTDEVQSNIPAWTRGFAGWTPRDEDSRESSESEAKSHIRVPSRCARCLSLLRRNSLYSWLVPRDWRANRADCLFDIEIFPWCSNQTSVCASNRAGEPRDDVCPYLNWIRLHLLHPVEIVIAHVITGVH